MLRDPSGPENRCALPPVFAVTHDRRGGRSIPLDTSTNSTLQPVTVVVRYRFLRFSRESFFGTYDALAGRLLRLASTILRCLCVSLDIKIYSSFFAID